MAVNELTGVVASVAGCLAVGAGFAWQMMRRKTVKPKVNQKIVSKDRRDANGAPVPNDHPAKDAVQKTQAVYDFEAVGVKRPTMLAVTAIRGVATFAEVFVQRAFKIDREHWRELEISSREKKSLSCLFTNACKLAWVPGSAFERHIYAVSFSPLLEEALKQGFHPRVNATAADLQICAIDETGTQLGEPMLLPDHSWGEPARVHALWCALNPTDKPHELAGELRKEVALLKERVSALAPYVSALTQRTWQMRMDEIIDLAHDLRRIGAETGQASERNARTDALALAMRSDAARIDEMVATHAKSVHTLEDADDALVHAIAYMHVRELNVRVLRCLALLRVIGGDTFAKEMHCANHVTSDVDDFTDVRPLIAAAEAIAHDYLVSGSGKTLSDTEVSRAGAITRHARELLETHDRMVADLRVEAQSVQEEIDRCLLWQSRPRRYAVRIDDYGNIEKMFVLNA